MTADKLHRKQPRSDLPPTLPRGFAGDSSHGTPTQQSTPQNKRAVKSDSKTYPLLDDAEAPASLLRSAAALLPPEKQQQLDNAAAKKTRAEKSTIPAHIQRGVDSGTMGSVDSQPDQQRSLDHAYLGNSRGGQLTSPAGLQSHRYSFDREMSDDRTLVTTSLLDPHPAIIPPPGSRLAFAGADSRATTNMFRSLPSLEDTLLRRAQAPLCLYNYWQYLADIEACPEELEFWLSLADYEDLCRRFTNAQPPAPGIGISPRSNQQRSQLLSIATAGSRFTAARAEGTAGDHQNARDGTTASAIELLTTTAGRLSGAYDSLDKGTQQLDNYLASLSYQTGIAAERSKCTAHRQCCSAHCPFTAGLAAGRPTLDTPTRVAHTRGMRGFFSRMFSGESKANSVTRTRGMRGFFSRMFSGESKANSVSASLAGSVGRRDNQEVPLLNTAPSTSNERKQDPHQPPIAEEDIRHAVEQLYFQYVLPGAPSELLLSPQMRDEIASRIERDRRFDAELFAPAKRHAYEAMCHESYPRFLRERLFHNITRGTAAPRIAFGLALIFIALTFQFSLIFLDVQPKGWRWLPLAVLWPGFIYAFAGVTRLDPFMALFGRYEPSAWCFDHVHDPAIRDSHLKRASLQLAVTALIAAVITLILFLVPGHHL
ncbi:hypothetical protein GQ54DRAFT_312715 [Martensiomyces pterosporus]|nr:hypothetical protein GQ54DRAFT_312715 [Martensiomyces pterosporus]